MDSISLEFQTRHGLPANVRSQVANLLNHRLALVLDLSLQAKQAHWNVKGFTFSELHELFDRLSSDMLELADLLAERVSQLGGLPRGTVQTIHEATHLDAYPVRVVRRDEHLLFLSTAVAQIGDELRSAADIVDELGDAASNDICIEALRNADRWLWILESHLAS